MPRYAAFISYSHSADDRLSAAIQSGLHTFARPHYLSRAMWVFRDKTDLSAHPALWKKIELALHDSQYLIVFASPAAARSPWVKRELDSWLRHREDALDHFIVVLTDGQIEWDQRHGDFDWTKTTALPQTLDWDSQPAGPPLTLSGRFHDVPFWVDARGLGGEPNLTLSNPRLLDVVASIAAEIRQKPKSDMIGEDAARHRAYKRTRQAIIVTLSVLLGLAVIALLYADAQRRTAETEAVRARRSAAEAQAEAALARGDANDALAWLAHAPASFGNASRLARALEGGPSWVLVDQAEWSRSADVAWSRDGQMLAWGADDSRIAVWDMRTGRVRYYGEVQHTFPDQAKSLAWSKDGAALAAHTRNGVVHIWHLATGVRQVLDDGLDRQGYSNENHKLHWSEDGTRLSAVVHTAVRVWRYPSGELIKSHDLTDSLEFDWSHDGRLLAGLGNVANVSVLDIQSGKWQTSDLPNTAFAWDPKGTKLATAGMDRRLRVATLGGKALRLGAPTAQVALRLRPNELAPQANDRTSIMGFADRFQQLAWSPKGNLVAYLIGEAPGLWDGLEHVVALPIEGVNSLAWSVTGVLATGTNNGDIALWNGDIWNVSTPRMFVRGHGNKILKLAWAPDGRALAVVSEEALEVFDTQPATHTVLTPPTLDAESTARVRRGGSTQLWFMGASWSSDGRYVAAESYDDIITVWRVCDGSARAIASSNSSTTWDSAGQTFSWSPDGQILAHAGPDGALKLREVRDLAERPPLSPPRPSVAVAWSPNGRLLASGGKDPDQLHLWAPHSGATTTVPLRESPLALKWSGDSARLAIAMWGGSLDLYDIRRKRLTTLRTPEHPQGLYTRLFWSGNDALAIRLDQGDGTVFDLESGTSREYESLDGLGLIGPSSLSSRFFVEQRGELADYSIGGDAVRRFASEELKREARRSGDIVAVSPDGTVAAVGLGDKRAGLLDLRSGELLPLNGHDKESLSFAWSPDGKILFSSAQDGTAHLWPIAWHEDVYRRLRSQRTNIAITDTFQRVRSEFAGLPWLSAQAASYSSRTSTACSETWPSASTTVEAR